MPVPEPAKSVTRAEERAYAGLNESQDSQVIFEKARIEHGVGLRSSSPVPNEPFNQQQSTREVGEVSRGLAPPSKLDGLGRTANTHAAYPQIEQPKLPSASRSRLPATSNPDMPKAPTGRHESAPKSSPNLDPDETFQPPLGYVPTADFDVPSPLVKNDVLPQFPRSSLLLMRRKMDISESPTQTNDARSYDQYRDDPDKPCVSSSPKFHESQTSRPLTLHETQHSTLHEDETGAVKFEWQSPRDHILDTQVVEDHNDDDGDGEDVQLIRPEASSHAPPTAHYSFAAMHAPETPAVAPRPFPINRDGGSVMGPSQLFGQTQFTSGIKKAASPTSSRPSPATFNQNSISPNVFLLQDYGLRTSPGLNTSPAFPPGLTTSPALAPATPSKPMPPAIIPESYVGRAQPRTRPDPIDEYVPIRSSSATPADDSTPHEDLDSDIDEDQQRHLRAKLKQDKAIRSLTSINISRQDSKDEIEVPSTRKPDDPSLSAADGYRKQCSGEVDATDKDESQETVADSQEMDHRPQTLPSSHPATGAMEPEEQAMAQHELPLDPSGPVTVNYASGSPERSKETIPETSPARTVGVPKIIGTQDYQERSSYTDNPSSNNQLAQLGSSSPVLATRSSPPILPADTASSQPSRRSSRLRRTTPVIHSTAPRESVATPSTLSALSATPIISSSTTPNTDTGGAQEKMPFSSPADAKVHRQVKPTSKLQTYSPGRSRNPAANRKLTRRSSVSTDELARSSPDFKVPPEERSRTSRSSLVRKSIESRDDPAAPSRHSGIFQGMTFAITFQSGSKLDKSERQPTKSKILQGGGSIVNEFDELFEANSVELKSRANMGFTALIADVHSRKVKYLQALALGVPCLSWKWVSHSVSANELVDWSPYVLCAGESRVLGTILSQNLISYNAKDAQLEHIIKQRPKLLNDSKILLVKGRARSEGTRMRYVFLARLLGASVDHVASLDEARAKLREKEDTDDPYDWVYTEGDTEESLFGQTSQPQVSSKKRKRESTSTVAAKGRPPKRIRTLTDELVVQTLIFGRLIREDEEKEMEL